MKRKIAGLLLAGAMTVNIAAVSTAAHAVAFTDVPDDTWYSQAVDYAVSHGMFSGTGAGTFSPSTPMTRGMIVVVLSNVAKADVSSAKDASFSDVQSSDWYANAINWAYEQGYVSGTEYLQPQFCCDTCSNRGYPLQLPAQHQCRPRRGWEFCGIQRYRVNPFLGAGRRQVYAGHWPDGGRLCRQF